MHQQQPQERNPGEDAAAAATGAAAPLHTIHPPVEIHFQAADIRDSAFLRGRRRRQKEPF